MRVPLIFKIWFAIIALFALGVITFQVFVFKDCMNHDKAMYQCASAMTVGRYVAFENISE